jgi:hypothetical protein
MRHISLKLTDDEYNKLESLRGTKTKTDYIKMLLSLHDESARNENADFHKLFSDVNLIRESLNISLKGMATKKDLLALSSFMAEVASMANPPAYSHHKIEIQQLYQTLTSKMQSGE